MSEENAKPAKRYYDYVSVGNRTKQTAYFVQQHDKNRMFCELLKSFDQKRVVALVKSKKSADKLMQRLKEENVKSLAVHGNHRAVQIQEFEAAFNAKEINVLITTDRILDSLTLENVQILVNYDLPLEASDYFGRLRLVDEIGESISLIDPEDERTLATIELMMKRAMDEIELENFEHTKRSSMGKKDRTKKPRRKKSQTKRKSETESETEPN